MKNRYYRFIMAFAILLSWLSLIPKVDLTAEPVTWQRYVGIYETPTVTPSPGTPIPVNSGISGTVTASDGTRLENIYVYVYRFLGNQWAYGGATVTDVNGNYQVNNLEAGTYRVYFIDFAQRYRAEYYEDSTTFSGAQQIAVPTNTTVEDINAVLETPHPPLATVSGGNVNVNPDTGEVSIGVPRGSQQNVTITRAVSCDNGATPTNVTLAVGSNTFSMTGIGNNEYSVTLTTPDDLPASFGSLDLSVNFECDGQANEVDIGQVTLYDPSGIITDMATSDPIEGATVNLYRVPGAVPDANGQSNDCRTTETRPASGDGPYGNWNGVPAASINDGVWENPALGAINNTQEISPTINPQITGSDGRYGWDVVLGCWYVVVEADGYETIVSPLVGVPPEVTDLDIALTSSISPNPKDNTLYLPIIVR